MKKKLTANNILEKGTFYSTIHQKALKYARMRDAIFTFPRVIEKSLKPPLASPAIANEDESDDLQGEGMKNIVPSNVIDICSLIRSPTRNKNIWTY